MGESRVSVEPYVDTLDAGDRSVSACRACARSEVLIIHNSAWTNDIPMTLTVEELVITVALS